MEAPVSRTKLLQEIRKMRFEEAYVGWQEKRLTQEQAAEILGVTDRSFRRYAARYEAEGMEGLIDRRIEVMSARRAPADEVMRLVETYRSRRPAPLAEAVNLVFEANRVLAEETILG